MSKGWKLALLIFGGLLSIGLVAGVGTYQFRVRAGNPVDIVKSSPISGGRVTVGEGILDFIRARGIEVVSDGFKPTWGAEQVGDHEWVVSYVFEVGREARWASWKVDTRDGRIEPRNDLAREVLGESN